MPEENPISASFVLTLEEVKAARSLYSKRPHSGQIIAVLVVLIGLSPIVYGVLTGRIAVDRESFSLTNSLLIVLAVGLFYFMFRAQARSGEQRTFLQDPASNKRVDLSFSSEGIRSRVEGLSETSFQWSGFVRVRRTAQGFLFYQGPRTILWVPEHAFASQADAEAVAALARERAVNYSES